MKVAIVLDWLNAKRGGAEAVVTRLAELYPQAPVYTLLYDEKINSQLIDPSRIRTSFLQHFPAFLRKRARYLLPFAPAAIQSLDLSGYDLVISSSSAFAKSVITDKGALHVCYCYSPMRYAWDYWPRYVQEQGVGPVRSLAIRLLVWWLRRWDLRTSTRVDHWIAISRTVQDRITRYYGKSSTVIYPPSQTPKPPKTRVEKDATSPRRTS